MPTLQWDEVMTVHVGDTAPDLWFFVAAEDGNTGVDITGCAAGVAFWYAEAAAPHVYRQAVVDEANRLIKYALQGDEYPSAGEVFIQWTLIAPTENGVAARGFFKLSGPIVRRTVLA